MKFVVFLAHVRCKIMFLILNEKSLLSLSNEILQDFNEKMCFFLQKTHKIIKKCSILKTYNRQKDFSFYQIRTKINVCIYQVVFLLLDLCFPNIHLSIVSTHIFRQNPTVVKTSQLMYIFTSEIGKVDNCDPHTQCNLDNWQIT